MYSNQTNLNKEMITYLDTYKESVKEILIKEVSFYTLHRAQLRNMKFLLNTSSLSFIIKTGLDYFNLKKDIKKENLSSIDRFYLKFVKSTIRYIFTDDSEAFVNIGESIESHDFNDVVKNTENEIVTVNLNKVIKLNNVEEYIKNINTEQNNKEKNKNTNTENTKKINLTIDQYYNLLVEITEGHKTLNKLELYYLLNLKNFNKTTGKKIKNVLVGGYNERECKSGYNWRSFGTLLFLSTGISGLATMTFSFANGGSSTTLIAYFFCMSIIWMLCGQLTVLYNC